MIDIIYGFKFYDNIPLILGINVNYVVENIKVPAVHYEFVLWDKITNTDIELYKENLRYFCMDLYNEALYCNNERCNIEMHKRMLDDVYNYIYSCIFEASSHFKCVKSRSRYKPIAGWNDHCQDLYRKCREIFLAWSNNGRTRYGDLFETMKRSRKDFKNALDYCKNNEMKLKKEKMLASFVKNNKIIFWKCCN